MRVAAEHYVPQVVSSTTRPFVVWLVIASGVLLFSALIVSTPLIAAAGSDGLAGELYRFFGFICHQIPERSFFINGQKFAVCSRCTGIYFGATLLLLFYPLLRSLRSADTPPPKWLIVAAIPLFLDFLLTFVGIWENTHASRFLTGLLLGSVVIFYIMPGVVELSMRGWKRRVQDQTVPPALTSENVAGPSDYSAPERRI